MWRPKYGWKNPHKDDVHLDAGVYNGLKREAYEAGADAILKALKKKALIRRIILPAPDELLNDLSDFELTSSGWLVFIPDGVEGKE